MAYNHRRIFATLTGPSGPIDHQGTLKVSWAVDRGWTWSCSFSQSYDIGHAVTSTYSITLDDGFGNTLTTPDLVALQRTERDSKNTGSPGIKTLSGVDLTTFKMGRRNQSFPSFRATDSNTLLNTLATRAGVSVSGLAEWYIGEEEVKGETLASAINRLAKAAAYDAVVGTSGAVVLTAWEDSVGSLDFPIANVERSLDPSQIFTGVRLGKRTSRPQGGNQTYSFDNATSDQMELSAPLLGPEANSGNDMGALALGAVAFFDGDPDLEATGLVAFQSFDPTYVGPSIGSSETGIATHMVVATRPLAGGVTVYPIPAILVVTGTPYEEDEIPEGVDLAFLYPEPNGDPEDPETYDTSLGDWPSDQDAIDPLFPGQGWAADRYPSYLAKLNSPGDTLSINGTFHLGPRPLQRYSWGEGSYKVWEISWDVGSIQTQLALVRA